MDAFNVRVDIFYFQITLAHSNVQVVLICKIKIVYIVLKIVRIVMIQPNVLPV